MPKNNVFLKMRMEAIKILGKWHVSNCIGSVLMTEFWVLPTLSLKKKAIHILKKSKQFWRKSWFESVIPRSSNRDVGIWRPGNDSSSSILLENPSHAPTYSTCEASLVTKTKNREAQCCYIIQVRNLIYSTFKYVWWSHGLFRCDSWQYTVPQFYKNSARQWL